jgi:hypothetical protein
MAQFAPFNNIVFLFDLYLLAHLTSMILNLSSCAICHRRHLCLINLAGYRNDPVRELKIFGIPGSLQAISDSHIKAIEGIINSWLIYAMRQISWNDTKKSIPKEQNWKYKILCQRPFVSHN